MRLDGVKEVNPTKGNEGGKNSKRGGYRVIDSWASDVVIFKNNKTFPFTEYVY